MSQVNLNSCGAYQNPWHKNPLLVMYLYAVINQSRRLLIFAKGLWLGRAGPLDHLASCKNYLLRTFSALGGIQVFIFSRSGAYIRSRRLKSWSLRSIGNQLSTGASSGCSAAM